MRACSPRLVVCREDSRILVLNAFSGASLVVGFAPNNVVSLAEGSHRRVPYTATQLSPTDLLVAGYGGHMMRVDLELMAVTQRTRGNSRWNCWSLAHLRDFDLVASGGKAKVHLSDVASLKEKAKMWMSGRGISRGPVNILLHHRKLPSFLFSSARDSIMWDLTRRVSVGCFVNSGWRTEGMAFDPIHSTLFTGSTDRSVRLFDIRDGEEISRIGVANAVQTILYRPRVHELIVPQTKGEVLVFDVRRVDQPLQQWNSGLMRIRFGCFMKSPIQEGNLFVLSGLTELHAYSADRKKLVWKRSSSGDGRNVYDVMQFREEYGGDRDDEEEWWGVNREEEERFEFLLSYVINGEGEVGRLADVGNAGIRFVLVLKTLLCVNED